MFPATSSTYQGVMVVLIVRRTLQILETSDDKVHGDTNLGTYT